MWWAALTAAVRIAAPTAMASKMSRRAIRIVAPLLFFNFFIRIALLSSHFPGNSDGKRRPIVFVQSPLPGSGVIEVPSPLTDTVRIAVAV